MERADPRVTVPDLPGLDFLSVAGTGGMSVVWKARERDTGRIVAVKVLNREFCESVNDVDLFRSEESLLAEIRHPGVVAAYGLHHDNGLWYIVMEYVDGYTFADLLRRKQHVSEPDCLLICQSVAAALNFAWNGHGIVHCDIKPENIMINSEGVVKLTDLGISHRFEYRENGRQEVPDHVTGTPAYISPEQVYGDVELDCRADIYALGATLFHLATGRVLFPGLTNEETMRAHCGEATQARDPRLYRPELSEGFAQLLEAMLVKNRDGRLATWSDVFLMSRDVENGTVFKPRAEGYVSSVRLSAAVAPASR